MIYFSVVNLNTWLKYFDVIEAKVSPRTQFISLYRGWYNATNDISLHCWWFISEYRWGLYKNMAFFYVLLRKEMAT